MRSKPSAIAAGLLIPLTALVASGEAQEQDVEFTSEFPIDDCRFVPARGNPYFNLTPGSQTSLTDGEETVQITVTGDVKRIWLDGRSIVTRVVEEYETEDGELTEISRNYFATCLPSLDVYYFGEDVDIYEGGVLVSHEGAWLAGENGAQPGIIMPESGFILGSRYYQEIAPGVAEDRAEHVANGLSITVPAGIFDDCIEVEETTPLEPDVSIKIYCPGVGIVMDEELQAYDIRIHGSARSR